MRDGIFRRNLPDRGRYLRRPVRSSLVTPDQFLERCKSLRHIAPAGTWEQIVQHGLRTADQLIRNADLDDDQRAKLLDSPRLEPVRLTVDGAEVVLRDQTGLIARKGPAAGDEPISPESVHRLNRRLYLFTATESMNKMIDRYLKADGSVDVITLSPMRVVNAARPRIEIPAANTGEAARRSGSLGGRTTFVPLGLFPNKAPAEVTIIDGLDDIAVIVHAERYRADGTKETLAR